MQNRNKVYKMFVIFQTRVRVTLEVMSYDNLMISHILPNSYSIY